MSDSKVVSVRFAGRQRASQVLAEAIDCVSDDDVLVVAFRDKDDQLVVGWSDGYMTDRIGLCHVLIDVMMDYGRDE